MLHRNATWKECYQALKENHYPPYSLWFLATFAWLTDTQIHTETQEEWEEHHRQLKKHLDGVEQRYLDCWRKHEIDWYASELAPKKITEQPPDREWIELTDDDLMSAYQSLTEYSPRNLARAIAAKLKEKNYD